MQSTNIPSKIPLPFAYAASSGYINTIPAASQIGITNGRASLHDGFPPDTFTPISSGGVPPFGGDFNGILNEITAIQQWQEAGGFFPFDPTFSTAIGGYPKGAILQAASFSGLWTNTVENNTTNPDAGGAGWVSLAFEGLQAITVTTADVTVTQLQSAFPIIVLSGTLTGARNLIFPAIVGEWIVQNNTTGLYNLTAKTASGTGVTLTQGQSTYIYCDGTNIYFADSAKVASFNGRVGTISLTALDVTTAIGYTPYNASNPAGYISSINYGMVVAALGYTPYPSSNPAGYISSINYGMVVAALGFTPYNVTNPAGYISSVNYAMVVGALGFTPIPNTQKFGLGITGETWHSVSRSIGTSYSNPYSYPIAVSASVYGSAYAGMQWYVNGILLGQNEAGTNGPAAYNACFFIVPPGATYQINSGTLNSWAELY